METNGKINEDDSGDTPPVPSELDRLAKVENGEEKPPAQGSGEGQCAAKRQLIAALIAHFGAVLMAEVWSFSATALPSLRKSMTLSATAEAYIASITFLGGTLGGLVSGAIVQKFGVKKSLSIVTVPVLLGWLLIIFSVNLPMILVGRFITGAFIAAIGVSTKLIAEISHPKRRGRLNFLFDMNFCVGVLLIYVFGAIFDWRVQAVICGSQCILFLVLLLKIHESPRFLLEKQKKEEARRVFVYYMDKADVQDELDQLQQEMARNRSQSQQDGSADWKTFFTDATVLKPIFIALSLQFFLQLCGVVPIVCYAVDVFKEAGSTHENLSTCIFGLVNLVATCVGYFCIDKLGRKTLMMISEIGLTLTLFGLGLFLYYKDSVKVESLQSEYYSWVPLVFLIIYIIAYSFGVGPIPWVVMGEVMNPKAIGFSSGIIIFAARVFGFLAMLYFNELMGVVGQHGVYWIFAGICLSGLIFSIFLLPETKEKELELIQNEIKSKWIHFKRTV